MMVVAILALMGVAGIPALQQWWHDGAVKNAAHSLMFHLKESRVAAMAQSRKIWIAFSDPNNCAGVQGQTNLYIVDADTTPGCTCTSCKNLVVDLNSYANGLKMTKKNSATQLPPNISFSPRGTSVNASVDVLSGSSKNRVVVNIVGRAYMCNQNQIINNQCK